MNRLARSIVLAYYFLAAALLCLATAAFSHKPNPRAMMMMTDGLYLIWCVGCGAAMYGMRRYVRQRVNQVRMPWQVTFILFATALALLEEAVTTMMTNSAPLFGSAIGKAYITASTNYIDVVCLHSVVVIAPMFCGWAFLLSRYSFQPGAVMLLFGLTGTVAEVMFGGPAAFVMLPFWSLVYGLMVWLPAYAFTAPRIGAVLPRWYHYIFAVFAPILFAMPVAILIGLLHHPSVHFPPIK